MNCRYFRAHRFYFIVSSFHFHLCSCEKKSFVLEICHFQCGEHFARPGAAFTVNGADAPRDAAVFGLGMTLALRSFDLFVRYEGTAGNGATMQGGTGGLRFLF